MYAASIDLRGHPPTASLLAYWYVESLLGTDLDFWAMMRWGYVQGRAGSMPDGLRMVPPSGSTTDHILFIGSPVEAVELASKAKHDEVVVDLLAVGISERIPPVSQGMLRNIRHVLAPPEARRWLERCRVTRAVEVPLPVDLACDRDRAGPGDDSELRILWSERVEPGAERLPFKAEHKHLLWRDDGIVIKRSEVARLARWSDVYVRRGAPILDDPIEAMLAVEGVLTVPLDPRRTLPARLIEAARHRRAGTFIGTQGGAGGPERTFLSTGLAVVEALERPESSTAGGCGAVTVPHLVHLGVVVPFGGLPVEGLRDVLEHLYSVMPEGTQVVVAHQQMPGSDRWASEVDEVDELQRELGFSWAVHQSESGWRLGLARNRGVKLLSPGVTHIVFIDADVYPEDEFFSEVVLELSGSLDVVLSPHIRNEDGSVRIGSGVSIFPRELFERVGGFGESFEGWGFEDLDLLARMRREVGTPAVLLGTVGRPLLRHRDHEDRWVETRDENWTRYANGSGLS